MLPIRLKSGPLVMTLDSGSLRWIRCGRTEVLRQIYAAVRGPNWETLPGKIEQLKLEESGTGFMVELLCDHGPFEWHGMIRGRGTEVVFEFEGFARKRMLVNRVGLCVLHPSSLAGTACTVEHCDGVRVRGSYPKRISPHQPFRQIRSIQHQVDGLTVTVCCEGEVFEMEDQRNWLDASYKTYSRPLDWPFPYVLEPNQKVSQGVRVWVEGEPTDADSRVWTVGEPQTLPKLGVWGKDELPFDFTYHELTPRRALPPATGPRVYSLLLDDELEADAFAGESGDESLRWMVATRTRPVCSAEMVSRLHHVVGKPVVGGTDGNFAELNRNPPQLNEAWGGVRYSANPQVHAFDDASILECAGTFASQLESARLLCPVPIHVGPITLRPRWNPAATSEQGAALDYRDAREAGPLGAAWVILAIASLTRGRAASATFATPMGLARDLWSAILEKRREPARLIEGPSGCCGFALGSTAFLANSSPEVLFLPDGSMIEPLGYRIGSLSM